MNELERLIANLPCPYPSAELDAGIAELTAPRPGRGPDVRARLRRGVTIAACTALAAVGGFWLGRNSVRPSTAIQTLASTSAVSILGEPPPTSRAPSGAATTTDSLADPQAVLNFVTLPRRTEKLFGERPLTEQLHSPVLE